jgi:hypothetical protein
MLFLFLMHDTNHAVNKFWSANVWVFLEKHKKDREYGFYKVFLTV